MMKEISSEDTCGCKKTHNARKEISKNIQHHKNSDEIQTSDEIKVLGKALEDKTHECEANKDMALRALADLENYKKRMRKESLEIRDNTIAEIFSGLISVIDNFELGLVASEKHGQSEFASGFKMILSNFKSLLSSYGLQEIFPIGQKFDVDFHECVKRVEDDSCESETIIAVERKGYKLNDRLLRAAAVIVSCKTKTTKPE